MKIPLFIKAPLIIIGTLALFTILYIAQSIIVPLIFAAIFAIVLFPAVNWLIRKKINRILSIVIIFLIAFLVLTVLGILMTRQLQRVSDSWPQLSEKINTMITQTTNDASVRYNIDPQKIQDWIASAREDLSAKATATIGATLAVLGNAMVILLLVPVYVFMILYYQPLLHEFISKLFSKGKKDKVFQIISETKILVQQYLVGLVFEFVIVATLNTSALLFLGIEYAMLLGIMGALLNVIPYIGGIISVALYMIFALITKSPEYVLYVFIAYTLIQFIDNNYIIPKIVASKVRINALVSIIVVIAGNALWGIPGMFLAIPLLAIVKLIFDNIEHLKPWGFLLGDSMPTEIKIPPILKKLNLK